MTQPHFIQSRGTCSLLVKVLVACCIVLAALMLPGLSRSSDTAINFAKGATAWISSCRLQEVSIKGLSTVIRLNRQFAPSRRFSGPSDDRDLSVSLGNSSTGRILQGSPIVISPDHSECPKRFDRLSMADIASKAVAPYIFGGQQQPSCTRCKEPEADSYYAGLCKFHRTGLPRDG